MEEREAQVLVGKRELAGVSETLERRVRLDCELVKGDVVAGEVEAAGELCAPGGFALPGPAVDQVEGETRKEGRREPHGRIASSTLCRRPSAKRSASASA